MDIFRNYCSILPMARRRISGQREDLDGHRGNARLPQQTIATVENLPVSIPSRDREIMQTAREPIESTERPMMRSLEADGPYSELKDKLMLFGQFAGNWQYESQYFLRGMELLLRRKEKSTLDGFSAAQPYRMP